MSSLVLLRRREVEARPLRQRALEHEVSGRRARSLSLLCARPRDLFPTHCQGGGVASLALDTLCADRFLLAGLGGGELRLHDLEQSAERGPVAQVDRAAAKRLGHKYAVSCAQWFAGDNGLFVTGSPDGACVVWDTSAFLPAFRFPLQAAVSDAALSPLPGGRSGKLIATATRDPKVRLCDLASGGTSQVLEGHRGSVLRCAFSPASDVLLATGGADRTVRLWDLRRSGRAALLALLDHSNARREATDAQNTAHEGAVRGLKFCAGGQALLSSGGDGKVRLWRARGARAERYENSFLHFSAASAAPQPVATTGVFCVADTSCPLTKRTLVHATGAQGSSLAAFDLASGEALPMTGQLAHAGHFLKITGLVFRESAQEMYSASQDGLLLKWASSPPGVGRDDDGDEDQGQGRGARARRDSPDDDWDDDM
jgi:DNA excision repair protein ERCC-8